LRTQPCIAAVHIFDLATHVVGSDDSLLDEQLAYGDFHRLVVREISGGIGARGVGMIVVMLGGHVRPRMGPSSWPACGSGRLQPVLVDLQIHRVRRAAAVVGPHVALSEAYAIQRLRRKAIALIRKLFWIGIGAARAFDHAALPANVPGCPYMPGWK